MRKVIIVFSLILSVLSFAQTQTEMNIDSYNQYLKVDKELNIVYNQILKKYSSDKNFIKKLKVAQNLWIKFRDAEAEARFPEENKKLEYGSMYPMCVNDYFNKLTLERIKQLKIWLNGIPEDELCSGSVK